MYEVLIIGCGNIAGGFDADRPADGLPLTHAGAFEQDPAFRVTACVDPDPARLGVFQTRWQIEDAADSVAALGAVRGRFAVVSICSPTTFHAGHIEAALALQPRLIFCEKPVAPTAAETRALADRCAAAGVILVVNYTRRWDADVIRLAEDLRTGIWGEVRSATGIYTKGIVHNGGHMIDLLHLLLGDLSLVSAGVPRTDFWDDDPTVPALLTSVGGVPVTLATGDAGDYALFELTLVTERGTITMLDGGRRWAVRRAGDSDVFAGYRSLGDSDVRDGRYDGAMRDAVSNIAAVLENGAPPASHVGNALSAQILCETIRNAARAATVS